MLFDTDGVIVKLNTKSVIQFLESRTEPLLIYGSDILKGEARFTIDILLKKGIKIEAIGDTFVSNHQKLYEEISIYPIEELSYKYRERNPIIWITIADEQKRKEIIQICHKNGLYKNILDVDITNPVSERYYYDYNHTLPMVFIGDHNMYRQIEGCQNENKEKYVIDVSKNSIFTEIPKLIEQKKEYNWIICKDDEWVDIISILHKYGVVENIYRYIRGIYGKFSGNKYTFLQSQIRKVLYKEMGFFNTCYQLIGTNYKEIYKKMCKDFLNQFIYRDVGEQEILKLLESYRDEFDNENKKKLLIKKTNMISIKEYYSCLKFIRIHLVKNKENLKNLEYNMKEKYILVEFKEGGEVNE